MSIISYKIFRQQKNCIYHGLIWNIDFRIDHGYGNIKTAHRVFPTALIKSEKAPTFSKDYLEYDGYFYIVGEGHKSFIAEKQSDDDNYILTLAAIAKELNARKLISARVHLAVGIPADKSIIDILHVFELDGILYREGIPDFSVYAKVTVSIENMNEIRRENFRRSRIPLIIADKLGTISNING